MGQFIRLTLGYIPWFAAAMLIFAAVGYASGDLQKLSSSKWPSLLVTGPVTVVALSAVGAAQALFRRRGEKRHDSN